ncbi:MAG: hypothetical protein J6V93_00555 [Clostridia bacterium]|nr:hypothetical protein [Clostridia bacterium]
MAFSKENINKTVSLGRARELIVRLAYVKNDECEYASNYNRAISEKIMAFATADLPVRLSCNASAVVLLTPYITLVRDGILSVKYDFTVSADGALLFHRRFGINMLTKKKILLLSRFISGKVKKKDSFSYYLLPDGDKILYVPIIKSLNQGTRIQRASEIDAYCDGAPVRVKIKIPPCLDAGRIKPDVEAESKALSHSSKP